MLIDNSTDELEQFLTACEARIGQARAAQMAVLAELDRRQVATGDGCRTLAEWVAGRLDVAPETARRLARTSRTFQVLPVIRQALGEGEVTFDRAAQIARTATSATENEDLAEAARFDIAGLRRRAALHKRVMAVDDHDAYARRALMIQPNLDESVWNLWGTLAGYDGRLVDKALQHRAEQLPAVHQPDSRTQRAADALVSIAQGSLTGSAETSESAAPLVTVFVDASTHLNSSASAAATNGETGTWIADGPRVGPATLERVLCEGVVEVIGVTEDGRPLAIGKAGRAIAPKLRRFVLARDGACTADGCSSRYRLQPHHKVPDAEWRRGAVAGKARHDPHNLTTSPPFVGITTTLSFTAGATPSTQEADPIGSGSTHQAIAATHPDLGGPVRCAGPRMPWALSSSSQSTPTPSPPGPPISTDSRTATRPKTTSLSAYPMAKPRHSTPRDQGDPARSLLWQA